MRAPKSAEKNPKSVQASKVLGHFAKTDIRYWQQVLFHQSYTRNGKRRQTKDWAFKIAHDRHRETFPLGTTNKAAAAAKARDIYLSLQASGWEQTLARYKPRSKTPASTQEGTTVGSYLEAIFHLKTNRSTVEGYAVAFRKIVADIFGLSDDPAKFDYQSGGREKWLAKVNAVPLNEVTPARIQQWKQSFLSEARDDPLALRKARTSANTFLRRSRSLFSPKMLRQLQLPLPSPLPFAGVEFEPRQSMKYRSNVNVVKLIKLANNELKPSDPSAYMVFLLAVAAGLRRKEIDLLEWSAFRFNENVIRIEPTQFFHPKSEDSIGEIQVDPEIVAIFRQYHAKAKGPFVIPSRRPPKTVLRGDYYRCEQHIERLNAWLRKKGVKTQKPLHTLRKEFGSLVNQAHGIHAASKALRHADINVTNNFYTDSRIRVTAGLGKLFSSKKSGKSYRTR